MKTIDLRKNGKDHESNYFDVLCLLYGITSKRKREVFGWIASNSNGDYLDFTAYVRKRLCGEIGIAASNLSGIIKELENAGLIKKNDGRIELLFKKDNDYKIEVLC